MVSDWNAGSANFRRSVYFSAYDTVWTRLKFSTVTLENAVFSALTHILVTVDTVNVYILIYFHIINDNNITDT